MSFDDIWRVADAAWRRARSRATWVRCGCAGDEEIHAAGRTAVEPDSPPMRPDTLFRIASITKPMGGVLTLSLVEDGLLGLDDEVAQWAPELGVARGCCAIRRGRWTTRCRRCVR